MKHVRSITVVKADLLADLWTYLVSQAETLPEYWAGLKAQKEA